MITGTGTENRFAASFRGVAADHGADKQQLVAIVLVENVTEHMPGEERVEHVAKIRMASVIREFQGVFSGAPNLQ
jgi:hypothetical protein